MSGIIIGSGFDYKGPLRNFERDGFDTLKQLLAFDVDDLPDSFIATVTETGKAYTFSKQNSIDPKLGQWREIANSNDIIQQYTYTPKSSLLKTENAIIKTEDGENVKIKYFQIGDTKLSISDAEELSVVSTKQNGIKTYSFYKGNDLFGKLNFNADLVVKSGRVVKVGDDGLKVIQGILYKAYNNQYKTIYIKAEQQLAAGNYYYIKNTDGDIIAEGELKTSSQAQNVFIQNTDDEQNRFDASNYVSGSNIYDYTTLKKGVYLQLDIANQDYSVYINVKDLGGNYFNLEEVPLINKEQVKEYDNEWAMKISGQIPTTIINEDGSITTKTIDSLYYLDDDKTSNVGVNPKFEDFFKSLLTEKEARNLYLACFSKHPYSVDDENFKDIIGTPKGVYYNTEEKCIYIAYSKIDSTGVVVDSGWEKYSVDLQIDKTLNDDYVKYTLLQNKKKVGNILVPLDLVVSKGEVTLLTGDEESAESIVYTYHCYNIGDTKIFLQSGDVLANGQVYYLKTESGLFIKGGILTEFEYNNKKYYSIDGSIDTDNSIIEDSTYIDEPIKLTNGLYLRLDIANREQPIYIDFDKLVVRMSKQHDDENYKTIYTITQGKDNEILDVANIEIPDDRYITDGKLINLSTSEAEELGLTEGTYVKLTINNPLKDIYLNSTDFFVQKLSAAPELKTEGSTYYDTATSQYMKYKTAKSYKKITVTTEEELKASGYSFVQFTYDAENKKSILYALDDNFNPALIEDTTETKWRQPHEYENETKTLILY